MSSDPIIIRRRARPSPKGHHGGSWKVALADFAMAMMALFLVLWLVEVSSDEQKKAIADYFSTPGIFAEKHTQFPVEFSGTLPKSGPVEEQVVEARTLLSDAALQRPIKTHQEQAFDRISREFESGGSLSAYAQSLRMQASPEGIRIDIIEDGKRHMFGRGSENLAPYFEDLLLALAPRLAELNMPLKISGHTDAVPFSKGARSNNWELSHNRAHAALDTLVHGGYPDEQILQVVAMADRNLLLPEEPENPINRRIELLLLNDKVNRALPPVKSQTQAVLLDAKLEAEENQI